ncbi:MAG TPA: hypothetical protein VMF61_07910 [Candidatus Acidoferrales bacterium]|nr:hypothetical protein [Candidatus Acidoferrales bacterium]
MKTLLTALAFAVAAFSIAPMPARADEGPTYAGPLSPDEQSWVDSMRRDLQSRFPHASDAIKAGYVRYTGEDDTGAISYANMQWTSDPTHPSQLWYDKNGNLLGADFSVPRPNNEPRPHLWGIDPGRWVEFNGHIHYVLKDPATNALSYDHWIWNADWVAAGGSLTDPSAETLVKLGKAANVSDVATVFEFPTIWDLIVWVKDNPNGPFAWKNPLVSP